MKAMMMSIKKMIPTMTKMIMMIILGSMMKVIKLVIMKVMGVNPVWKQCRENIYQVWDLNLKVYCVCPHSSNSLGWTMDAL